VVCVSAEKYTSSIIKPGSQYIISVVLQLKVIHFSMVLMLD